MVDGGKGIVDWGNSITKSPFCRESDQRGRKCLLVNQEVMLSGKDGA
jgi:hypothetical protein